ncbi:MAG: DNRLRE domain-containing protein, partial [Taibaiella sp.]|nr:DNRLRE domain-containing protein [Taibaiella sp.]
IRTVLNFSGISNIPQGAVINKAELKLHGWSNPTLTITVGNSYYPGSPYASSGSNEMLIKRITQSFHYPTVTWNTQPSTDTPVVITRPSQKQYEDDLQVDVRKLVQDMVTQQEFYGFMIMMQDETLYRSFGFHSCFAENPAKRPQLEITYTTVSVGLNNVLNENYLEVYPQPAADVVNVDYIANTSDDVQYSLCDMRGVTVVQGNSRADAGSNRLQLQLAHLPSGVYVFTMSDGRSQLRKRIVKQ